jgi:hypothetical protein
MKKRVLAIALAVLMLMALLTACGGGAEGKYVLDKMTIDGEDFDLKAFAELMDSSADDVANMFSMELKSGGKGTLTLGDDATEVTWKVDGKKLILTAEGETLECAYDGKTVTIEEDGSTLVMKKK